jgi:large subunit ribosomal protein L23
MKSAYQIIQKPVITEKGLGIKETQNTLVFQVAPKATKTEIRRCLSTHKIYSGQHSAFS